jgi:ligand-binding sensor domain-containing protein
MKNFFIPLCLFILLTSCDKWFPDNDSQNNNQDTLKHDTIRKKINMDFGTNILKGHKIYSFEFDKSGTPWLITDQGLVKYENDSVVVVDTVRFNDIGIDNSNAVWLVSHELIKIENNSKTSYTFENTPLANTAIKRLAIDSKNNVWFSSRKGIGVLKNGEFKFLNAENSGMPVVLGAANMGIDSKDNIWFTGASIEGSKCLLRYSESGWDLFTKDDFGFNPYSTDRLLVIKNNNVYCTIDYGPDSQGLFTFGPHIFSFDGDTSFKYTFEGYKACMSSTIGYDEINQVIWASARDGQFNLAAYDGYNWVYADSGFKQYVWVIKQAPDGRMWVGTEDGVFVNGLE